MYLKKKLKYLGRSWLVILEKIFVKVKKCNWSCFLEKDIALYIWIHSSKRLLCAQFCWNGSRSSRFVWRSMNDMYFHDILLSTLGKRHHHSFEQLTKLESSSPKNATCVAEIRQCIFTSFRLFPLVKNAWSLLYPINWCFVLRRFGWNSPGPKYNLKIAKCIFTIISPWNRTGFHHGRFARGRRNVISMRWPQTTVIFFFLSEKLNKSTNTQDVMVWGVFFNFVLHFWKSRNDHKIHYKSKRPTCKTSLTRAAVLFLISIHKSTILVFHCFF